MANIKNENRLSRLISIRIWEENCVMLDDIIKSNDTSLNRSYCINKILESVLTCTPADQLHEILYTEFPAEKCFRISFKKDADLLRQKTEAYFK